MDKALPHSSRHEKALLCCCMTWPAECLERTFDMFATANPFYQPENVLIYNAIFDMHDCNKISPITIMDYLCNSNQIEKVGGMSYVRDVSNFVPDHSQFELYLEWVGRLHQRRALIKSVGLLQDNLYNPRAKLEQLIEDAELSFKRTLSTMGGDSMLDMGMACDGAVSSLDDEISTLTLGYVRLDAMLEIPEGSMLLLAGRPGCGKTCLATSIMLNLGFRGIPTAGFSLEMPWKQLMSRMVSAVTEVNSRHIKEPQFRKRVVAGFEMIKGFPLYIDDKPSLSISEFIRKCRRLKAEHGVRFVVLDYLQRMNLEPIRGETRDQTVSRAAAEIKNTMLELGMVALVLVQLNRQAADGMPAVHHLRESGGLEQEADAVVLLHSDKLPLDELNRVNTAQAYQKVKCIVGKNRHGPTGVVDLPFWKPYNKFGTEIIDDEDVPD